MKVLIGFLCYLLICGLLTTFFGDQSLLWFMGLLLFIVFIPFYSSMGQDILNIIERVKND